MKMRKPTGTYNRFDIVLVPFPFIDSSESKKRPALILSSGEYFNSEVHASVLAMITTSSHNPWPLDILIKHLETTGLPAVSIIRMKLFTLDHRLILKKLGSLDKRDRKNVSDSLHKLFIS